jgi:hypothetical protein
MRARALGKRVANEEAPEGWQKQLADKPSVAPSGAYHVLADLAPRACTPDCILSALRDSFRHASSAATPHFVVLTSENERIRRGPNAGG